MSIRKLKLFKIFDETSNFLASQKINTDTSRVSELLSKLYSPGLAYQAIFDFSIRNFIYVSNSVSDLFGEEAATFTLDKLLNRIHPEDVEYFLQCNKIAAYFLFEFTGREAIFDYKISYQMRMRDGQGNYRMILHQAIPLLMDAELNLATALINQSDITHISNVNRYKISFINLKGNQSYYNINSIADLLRRTKASNNVLSNREMEILGYLSEGFSTKEIAENLSISPDTIRTHRNNILKKTSFKTISQAVGYFIRQGLI